MTAGSRTPARTPTAGPAMGQQTFEVHNELLGYDTDQIAELAAAEILD